MNRRTTPARSARLPKDSGATQVVALRLRPDEIAALEAFGRTIGVSGGQVLKLAGRTLADGRVAITQDEAAAFRMVTHELKAARERIDELVACLIEAEDFRLSALDDALAKLLAVLAVFEASAQGFADRRRTSLQVAVAEVARGRTDVSGAG
jgi:hypothetical protein